MAVALVTGTSSGIGLATAVALARAGHTVAATMRNLNAAGDIERIVAVEKLLLVVFELDINDDASVVNGVAGIVSRYGPIDITQVFRAAEPSKRLHWNFFETSWKQTSSEGYAA